MAFPGHVRSIGLSHISPGPALAANVHPDRHHHIISDYASTQENIQGLPKHSNVHLTPQDNNQDAYNRNYNNSTLSKKLSFREALAAGTDDQGNKPTTSLWIGNVPHDLTDHTLIDVFERFGPIVFVRAKAAKKCGFVNFEDTASAEEAWRDCHDRDIFDTGVATYVRYQPPPPWLRDKASLKRKRSSTKSFAAVSDDTHGRTIPTGPRSQTSNSLPPTGPKSQQFSISPPPLRRHDTYRPNGHPEEERLGRSLVEHHRTSDSYRPSYEDDIEDSPLDRRTSTHTRDEPSTRDRTVSHANTIGSNRSPALRSERSPSPSTRLLQNSHEEDQVSSRGIGIKGLAASRKESGDIARGLGETSQSGVSIRGAAVLTRIDNNEMLKASVPQRVEVPRNSHFADKASVFSSSMTQGPVPASQSDCSNNDAVPAKNKFLSLTSSPQVRLNQSASTSAAVRESKFGDTAASVPTIPEERRPMISNQLKSKSKGYDFLGHCYATKDQQKKDLLAKKARTISPSGRRRPTSRAKSVESAATDPTPIVRPLVSAKEVCDTCGCGSSFLPRLKCSTPACARMLHPQCARTIKTANSTELEHKGKILCVPCFHKGNAMVQTSASINLAKSHVAGNVQAGISDEDDKMTTENDGNDGPYKVQTIGYSFVKIDSPSVEPSDDSGTPINSAANGLVTTGSKVAKDAEVTSRSSIDQTKRTAMHQRPASATSDTQEMRNSVNLAMQDVPTGPRERRNEPFDRQACVIAERYKNTVTCPWWKRDVCHSLEDDCIFAHRLTGLESPSGKSIAKDWTCYNFYTLRRCYSDERQCYYSHTDTGLYVGVDGKASKKHLECWWWHHGGRCRLADDDCTCAHYTTGLLAKEPPSKDPMRRPLTQLSRASLNGTEMPQASQRRQARSPSYSPTLQPVTENLHSPSIPHKQLSSPLQELPDPATSLLDPVVQKNDPTFVTEAGVDPRLRRAMDSTTKIDQNVEMVIKDRARSKSPVKSTIKDSPTKGQGSEAQSRARPQQFKRPSMNPCKICSKKIFKAIVCTDCLKVTQQNDKTQAGVSEPAAEEDISDVLNEEVAVQATSKTTSFAVPAPKILKRSRTASSSNLFASKRMRPDLTAIRTATYPSPATSSLGSSTMLPSLEQLGRRTAEQKAQESARAFAEFEPDSSTIEVAMPNEVVRSPPNVSSLAETPASMTSAESSFMKSQHNRVWDQNKPSPNRIVPAKKGQTHQNVPQEAQDDSEVVRSDSEHTKSDSDADSDAESDTPLALMRSRSENLLWSSSTSTQSPQEAHIKTGAATTPISRTTSAPNGALPTLRSARVRCPICIKYHRKCVHTVSGEFDERKCYIWREDRERLGIKHKAHYSEAERALIIRKAQAYENTLNGDHKMVDVDEDNQNNDTEAESETSDEGVEEDDFSSSSDEIQISRRRDEAERSASRRTTLNFMQYDSPRMLSRSPTPDRRRPTSVRSRSAFIVPEGMMLVPKKPPEEDLTVVIARLKAKGVVFEDSDTSDDEEDELDSPKKIDSRTDPLLYHKLGNSPPKQSVKPPIITKGQIKQGLKQNIPLFQRWQMARNFEIFGDAHKQVDRRVERQEVSAMVERKDPNELLALPDQVEEKMTFPEFLGLQKGKEMKACLGKVSLARSTFTMELAFKEKDMDPGLGAWGRERRGNRREKPVFVIGM